MNYQSAAALPEISSAILNNFICLAKTYSKSLITTKNPSILWVVLWLPLCTLGSFSQPVCWTANCQVLSWHPIWSAFLLEYVSPIQTYSVTVSAPKPIPLTIFQSNSKFNLQCSGLKSTLPITTKCCTYYDSINVVTHAKFCCDQLNTF